MESATSEYDSLIKALGYSSASGDNTVGLIRGDQLRQNYTAGSSAQLFDRRFRYASVLDKDKLGVTDVFEINGAPCIYLKSLAADPTPEELHTWHRTAWNHGLGRMLWVVTPTRIRVFNAFAPPSQTVEKKHPAELLNLLTKDLEQLRRYELDRLSLENGQFWATKAGKRISKNTRIDVELASDLQKAAELLVKRSCRPLHAHRLMLRTLFTAYLEARGVLPDTLFDDLKARTFAEVLTRTGETRTFFERMRETFNGDLFPPPPSNGEEDESYSFEKEHLDVARAIVTRQDLTTGQMSFDFSRYDFEVIPIELISSIYERFIYAGDANKAKSRGTHYTPVNLVDLVYSQVFDDHLFKTPLGDAPKVLDLACGSGVFLVDAFRRLVARRIAAGEKLTRSLVRDVLSQQIYGVDLEETAIEIAAFSLCLTAFELDPSPGSVHQLKFRHSLKDRNLFVADAFSNDTFASRPAFREKQFSIVVGNPPWNRPKGERSTADASSRSHIEYCQSQDPPVELPYRSPIDQAFIWRSRDFAAKGARLGLILDAKNFFSQEEQSLKAKRQLMSAFRPRVMLNLSALHNKKLFPSAEQPAMVLVLENDRVGKNDTVVFASAERSDSFARHGIVEFFLERISHLPVSRVISEDHLLKIASFGTPRDRAILRELYQQHKRTDETLASWGTKFQTGFKNTASSTLVPDALLGLPKLEDEHLTRFHQNVSALPKFEYRTMERARDPKIYRAPVLLVQQSLQNDRLTAAMCENDVVYSRSYFGVPLGEHGWRSDLLNAFFNSSLATYCFLLTATRFGIDKQITEQNDLNRLPFKDVAEKSNIKDLSALLRELEKQDSDTTFTALDNAVFEFYELPDWQRDYISDTVKYDIDFFRHGSDSQAVQAPDQAQFQTYCETLVGHLRNEMSAGGLKVNADIVTGVTDVGTVVIRFDQGRHRSARVVTQSEFEGGSHLADLLHMPLTSGFQLRRSLVQFDEDRCLIVKLAQKRFWSRARAYDDADTILAELLRAEE